MLIGRQRETDLKSGRNALRTRHCDEQRMKVGAVAFLRVAGVKHVAVSPSSAGFVVAHVVEDVVVNGAGLIERRRLASRNFDGQFCGESCDGDQLVRSEVLLLFLLTQRRILQAGARDAQSQPFTTDDLVIYRKVQIAGLRFR